MKLSLDKIKEITTGAARIEESDRGISFYRYTKAQDELYKVRNPEFWLRSHCTAGIKLCFDTDSENLFLNIEAVHKTSRTFFYVDVLKNGEMLGCIDNIGNAEVGDNYIALQCPSGEFSKHFSLGKGEKRICIRLPWAMITTLKELSIDDGAFLKGVKKEKTLLAFGDSITHGYDALHPSDRYISRLADFLDADEYNKAIGGDIFFPDLAALKEDFEPDIITVAYGTNDWSHISEDEFKENCRGFYKNLADNYPTAKIFAITPIWRADCEEYRAFGSFSKVSADIREMTEDLKNVTVIEGIDFVPHDPSFFSDKYLHPNSKGFDHYFNNLSAEIKKYL